MSNLLFAAAVTAAYLSARSLPVSPGLDTVLPLARAARDGLPVREVAARSRPGQPDPLNYQGPTYLPRPAGAWC
jgi:hypothetical protein